MDKEVKFQGLEHSKATYPRSFENFELFVNLSDIDGSLMLQWSFNTNLFTTNTIKSMMTDLTEIGELIIKEPEISIKDILKSSIDHLTELRQQNSEILSATSVQELIAMQAMANPMKAAIRFGNYELSYQGLNEASNQFAAIFKITGIGAGDTIAVALDRSPDMLVVLLAILKSGASYLPIDPGFLGRKGYNTCLKIPALKY